MSMPTLKQDCNPPQGTGALTGGETHTDVNGVTYVYSVSPNKWDLGNAPVAKIVNLAGLGADYAMSPDEKGYIDCSAVSVQLLNVATGEDQLYRVTLLPTYNAAPAVANQYFWPNNTE